MRRGFPKPEIEPGKESGNGMNDKPALKKEKGGSKGF